MLVTIAKYATGLFYLIGGPLIHITLITQQRTLYAAVDDTAVPLYQNVWNAVVLPHLIPLVIFLIGLEMVAGALMLMPRNDLAQMGQAAGALFNALLVPFWFFYGIPNMVVLVIHLWILRNLRHTNQNNMHPSY